MPDDDDFAPHGSEVVKRSNLSRENLPPGRRNQESPVPVPPDAGDTVGGALRRLREAAGIAAEGDEEAPALGTFTPAEREDLLGPAPQVGTRQQIVALEVCTQALMFALRLRLLGEGDAGTWDMFDDMAEQALLACVPSDPMRDLLPVARFLWGATGLMRMPEEPTDIEQVADVVSLGEPQD